MEILHALWMRSCSSLLNVVSSLIHFSFFFVFCCCCLSFVLFWKIRFSHCPSVISTQEKMCRGMNIMYQVPGYSRIKKQYCQKKKHHEKQRKKHLKYICSKYVLFLRIFFMFFALIYFGTLHGYIMRAIFFC